MIALTVAAAAFAVAALAVLTAQVEVTDEAVPATRTCGSAFDSVADRSGWEVWWARDLDEPDDAVRSALVRTARCPEAINGRLAIASVLALAALSVAIAALVLRRGAHAERGTAGASGRIARLGRLTSIVGAGLTVAGLVGIVLLVADADSTLFLYTDRAVVVVIGLIVLVPAIALIVLGRALVLTSTALAPSGDEQGDG